MPKRTRKLTIVPRSFELIRHLECQVLLLDCPYVDMPDSVRLSSDGFQFNTVDQWFAKCNVFDTRVVEAVDVVPDYVCQLD